MVRFSSGLLAAVAASALLAGTAVAQQAGPQRGTAGTGVGIGVESRTGVRDGVGAGGIIHGPGDPAFRPEVDDTGIRSRTGVADSLADGVMPRTGLGLESRTGVEVDTGMAFDRRAAIRTRPPAQPEVGQPLVRPESPLRAPGAAGFEVGPLGPVAGPPQARRVERGLRESPSIGAIGGRMTGGAELGRGPAASPTARTGTAVGTTGGATGGGGVGGSVGRAIN